MKNFQDIPVRYATPHYSTKLWRSYYHYVKRFYSAEVFHDILEEMQMPLDYVIQDGNWVSNEFSKIFMEKLIEKTGDKKIAKNVGRYNLDSENINPFEHALLRILPPYLFFYIFSIEFKKANRLFDLKVKNKKWGFFSYSLNQVDKDISDPDVCEGLVGTFEGTQKLYKLSSFDVKHDKCIHRGSDECEFSVKYSSASYWSHKLLVLLAVFSFGFLCSRGFKFFVSSSPENLVSISTVLFALTFLLSVGLAALFYSVRDLIKNNFIHDEISRRRTLEMYHSRQEIDRRYIEAKFQRELSLKLVKMLDPHQICDYSVSVLTSEFNYSKVLLMLLNTDGDYLETYTSCGLESLNDQINHLSLNYPDKRDNALVFTKILESGNTKRVDDVERFTSQLTENNSGIIKSLKINSLIASPIQADNHKYGLLVVGRSENEPKLSIDEEHFIDNITRNLSLFFQNAKQYSREKSLRKLFQKYVPPVILDNVGIEETFLQQKPQERDITSMFIDLRGFSKMGEGVSASKVVELMNIYFEYVTAYIEKHGGLVDNLVGDGVVAFFVDGDPKDKPHQNRAMAAAADIITNLNDLNKEFVHKGFPRAGVGVGLHCGKTIVGTIGCDRKLNYTAIGDVVNLASRLEECSKLFFEAGNPDKEGIIVVSRELMDHIGIGKYVTDHGEADIRGRTKKVKIYEIDVRQAKSILKDVIEAKVIKKIA